MGRLDSADKRKLIPWMVLSAFALGLVAAFVPVAGGSRFLIASNVSVLVHGLVWFSLLHWRTKDPPEFGLFDFLENLLLPLVAGLIPAVIGAWLASRFLD